MDELMPIGEFSERSGLSVSRLRTYAAVGLLTPAAIDAASGYRYYSPGQVRDAQAIDALRRAEVPLADIASLLRDPSADRLEVWSRRAERDHVERRDALRDAGRLLAVASDPESTDRADPAPGGTTMQLTTATTTDIGRVRESNEDRALETHRLVAVADGMGGAPGGEQAAALTVSLLAAAFTGRSTGELETAARAANRAVFERAGEAGLDGMGTTLCAVGLTDDGDLDIVNVGDSRAYLLRGGELTQLTEDHSVTADLVRHGEIDETEAKDHPMHAVLTRAVGVGTTVDVDTTQRRADPGDRLLLCTDGLVNELSDDAILTTLQDVEDLDRAAASLVADAVANGGHDNVTVVVAEVTAG